MAGKHKMGVHIVGLVSIIAKYGGGETRVIYSSAQVKLYEYICEEELLVTPLDLARDRRLHTLKIFWVMR